MNAKDALKLAEIDTKIITVKSTYAEILAIYHQVHRKKLSLELDLKILEDTKMDLLQGQLNFDPNMGF